jgi:hypothetical protein
MDGQSESHQQERFRTGCSGTRKSSDLNSGEFSYV